jgi:hypothetical protein
VGAVLTDVLDTEITPELVPSGEDEEVQSSEAKVALRLPTLEDRLPGLARLA